MFNIFKGIANFTLIVGGGYVGGLITQLVSSHSLASSQPQVTQDYPLASLGKLQKILEGI